MGRTEMAVVAIVVLVLTPAQGAEWVARYDGPGESLDVAVGVVHVEGVPYVAGTQTGSDASRAFAVLKYDPDQGGLQAVETYQMEAGYHADAAAVAASGPGSIYVGGQAWGAGGERSFTVAKWNSGLFWQWTYNKASDDDAGCNAVVTLGDTVYATGYRYMSESSENNYWSCKLRPDSVVMWERDYGIATGEEAEIDDVARAVAVDADGNAYVTGQSGNEDEEIAHSDFATVKYDASGSQMWVARYDRGNHEDECGLAVTVDEDGYIYATGTCESSASGDDCVTIKLAGSGDTVWTRVYDGPGSGDELPCAIAVDAGGSIYVVGASVGSDTSMDWFTLKYNASGTLLWTSRHKGSANGRDVANGLCFDEANGWLYVTGFDSSATGAYDYLTVKYSVSNGESLSARRYDSPVHGNDVATGIAVDPDGNVFVTGRSDSATTDIVTVKYEPNFAYDVGVRKILTPPLVLDSGRTVVPSAVSPDNTPSCQGFAGSATFRTCRLPEPIEPCAT